jgi:RimJ/RimL family protein N-acetyltransferase
MNCTPEATSAVPPVPVLRGGGLLLSPWDAERPGDAEAWLRGRTDPEFRRWNTPLQDTNDLAGARESLREQAERERQGFSVQFRVADEASGRILGSLGVNMIDRAMRTARIGYWVLPEARGRGTAFTAVRLGARWALTDLGLHRLELGHAVGHTASCRVAEKSGFPYEGTLRDAMWEAGRRDAFRDVHLHARLSTDPEPV